MERNRPGTPPQRNNSGIPRNIPNEGERKNKAMMNGMSEAAAFFKGGIPGVPVGYKANGDLDINEPPPPVELDENGIPLDSVFDSELIDQINGQMDNASAPPIPPQNHQNHPQARQQPRQQPAPQPRPSIQRVSTQNYRMNPEAAPERHPVLQRMLQRYGLKSVKPYTLNLAKDFGEETDLFTMTVIPEEIQIWAIGQAQDKQVLKGSSVGLSWLEALTACASVVAINNTPVWEIFGESPRSEEPGVAYEFQEAVRLARNPYDIPTRIRQICSIKMADMFWGDTVPLLGKIHSFFEKIANENRVLSDYENEIAGKVRFVCPKDDCVVNYFETPENDKEDKPIPFFCKSHGVEMVRTTNPLAKAPE